LVWRFPRIILLSPLAPRVAIINKPMPSTGQIMSMKKGRLRVTGCEVTRNQHLVDMPYSGEVSHADLENETNTGGSAYRASKLLNHAMR
jgi:hypothetical protein